jgi:hypothetical protein
LSRRERTLRHSLKLNLRRQQRGERECASARHRKDVEEEEVGRVEQRERSGEV